MTEAVINDNVEKIEGTVQWGIIVHDETHEDPLQNNIALTSDVTATDKELENSVDSAEKMNVTEYLRPRNFVSKF